MSEEICVTQKKNNCVLALRPDFVDKFESITHEWEKDEKGDDELDEILGLRE